MGKTGKEVVKNQFELLAPGGDLESIKAAIVAGADAVYCGLDRFNARNRAENLTFDKLNGVIEIAREHDCKIFLTLNIIILESELPAITRLLTQLLNTDIDGVIVQDLGLAYILKHHFPQLDAHASTQMNTHNEGQMLLANRLGLSRVNLSRELNIDEIKHLAYFGRDHQVLTEVFVHGSYCIGFSDLCYISSARNGASGNRGRCSQPCRGEYQPTETGNHYPLNMKDNSAFSDMEVLADAGVYSLKIEGRVKKPHYVYTVTDNWRRQIDAYCNGQPLLTDTKDLYTVFNRDFSNGYLQGDISQDMFIDNPMDHSASYFAKLAGVSEADEFKAIKQELYEKKGEIIRSVEEKIGELELQDTGKSSLKGNGRNTMPPVGTHSPVAGNARLAVLVSSAEEADKLNPEESEIYFSMPNGMAKAHSELAEIFSKRPYLIPYFPAVIIGDDYDAAVNFLETVTPQLIVSNNSGIGFIAGEKNIDWIAGPQLNTSNSFAIKCLKEEFNCVGAFISGELNKIQMQKIVRPENFRLLYTLFHPNILLTSRQCLFQQSSGCKKIRINKGCLPRCAKETTITDTEGTTFILDKQKGGYNSLYGEYHVYNPLVLKELPDQFTHFMVDLRGVKTRTEVQLDTPTLLQEFSGLLNGSDASRENLDKNIVGTTNKQYLKGL